MLESISGLFEGERSGVSEGDIHHLIQQFLREELHGDGAYCERVSKGKITIQASTPTIAQEVRLLEYDIKQLVQNQTEFEIREVVVV